MERVRGKALCRGPEPVWGVGDPRDAVAALLRAAEGGSGAGVVAVGADGGAVTITYSELLLQARRLLGGLRERGVRGGDVVVLAGLPLAEFFPAFWGCVLGGALPVAIADPPVPGSPALERLRHACALLDRPLVLADAAGAESLARSTPDLRVAVVQECLAAAPADDHVEPAGSDVALLMLSSGSTGAPKAARLTHAGLADFAASTRRILDVRPDDTMVNWLPVDHSGAFLIYHLLGVFAGCTNVHAPTDLVLADPLRWLDLLHEHRARHSWAPTFAYRLVADALAEAGPEPGLRPGPGPGPGVGAERPGRRWELGGLKSLVCGGEQVLLPVLRRFLDATAAYGVQEGHVVPAWGMAETVTAVTYGRLDRPGTVHRLLKSSLGGDLVRADADTPDEECVTLVASGAPAHGITLRLVDDRGAPVPDGRVGRLQVHSPARLTPGYVNNPAADAAAFPAGRDWLDTGDLAFLDAGQIVITGRRKDLIILNGHNVYCHEVEDAATAVAGVRQGEVAACGIPHPERGTEELAVFFVSRGAAEDVRIAAEIRAALFTRLRLTATHVLPVPPDDFPRTPAGKVRRVELRDRLIGGGFGAAGVSRVDGPERAGDGRFRAVKGLGPDAATDVVREEIGALLGGPVDVHTPFYDLGLTSLLLVRLRARLEQRLAVRIDQAAFFEHPTAAALGAHLAGVGGRSAGAGAGPAAEPVAGSEAGRAPGPEAPPAAGPEAGPVAGPEAGAAAVSEGAGERRVAVVGMALRFPGADSVEGFWANLRDGVDSVRVFGAGDQGDGLVPVGGVLDGGDEFDAEFFGTSPKEAGLTHPAHRLFLECCHRALEEGGYAAAEPGTRIGVFAGSGMHLYDHQQATGSDAPPDPATGMQSAIGQQPDFLATRVAYRLGLTGPAIGVQTACSTSLVAVHLAVQALLTGETDLALAGAAAVHLPQESGYRTHAGSILSPTGRCRPFDADADGTVGGNGVAAVLLKRLDRALADGDTVHAVILGSAVNNDGAGKAGFSAPGVAGQVEVVRRALHRADVPADTVSYVEAHGTGTRLGDPVEFAALARALGEGTHRTGFCAVGSVKPNIGHLDSCAGMAGLIKTVLMLRHRTLVPTLHLDRPNPELSLHGGPLTLATELRPWPSPDGSPRRAGVSALGVGGTNAHVILEEAPARRPTPDAGLPVLVPVSARDDQALAELTGLLADRLRRQPDLAAADVAVTMAIGRPHRTARTAVVGRTAKELAQALEELASGEGARAREERPSAESRQALGMRSSAEPSQGLGGGLSAEPPQVPGERPSADSPQVLGGQPPAGLPQAPPERPPSQPPLAPVAFAFSGQGSARPGMAAGLYAAYPAARRILDRCEEVYGAEFGGTLLPLLLDETDAEGGIWPTETAQAALFAHQSALAEVWRAAGIRPALLLGHSVGEYAALYAGGALTLDDGLRLTAWRGRLMHTLCPPGGMLAVRAGRAEAERVARAAGAELAAVNGPRAQVISGPVEALAEAGRLLDREGLRWRELPVDRAFHSAAVESSLHEFLAVARQATFRPLHTPLVTTADGELRPEGWTVDAGHLVHQARQPVRFDLAMAAATAYGCADFLEIGAGNTITGLGRHCAPATRWLTGQGRDDQVGGLLTALGSLYERGAALDWRAITPEGGRVPLPGHPLRRRPVPFLARTEQSQPPAPASAPAGELLKSVQELAAEALGGTVADIAPDSSFFDFGADSLALMGMTARLEQRYGVRIPVRELFDTADTPRRLAERLRQLLGGAEPEPEPPVAVPVTEAGPPSSDLHDLFGQQLRLAQQLADQTHELITRQLDLLAAAPANPVPAPVVHKPNPSPAQISEPAPAQIPEPEPAQVPEPELAQIPEPTPTACDFSLYFFGDYPDGTDRDKYGLIMEAADFADRHGFHALWFPERHFESFGALFPNPSVLAAALAARTSRIRLHAGSVVLPLHHPVRVAEEWSVVDNISGGRAGLCVASGWRATDFALAPENFGRHREVMYEQLATVRKLWSGQPVTVTAGDGEPAEVLLHPRPVQEQPPLYVAVVGNPDSYRRAAAEGLGVVTNLMAQTVEQLAENIALYRRTRAEHGLDPAAGRVVVLVHTYLGEDAERARAEAYRPFVSYLRSSLSLFDQVTNSLGFEVDLANTPEEDVEFLLGRAYERYCASRALIGDERTAAEAVHRLVAAGADEIACFVDFGVPKERVLAALPVLDRVRRHGQTEDPARTEEREQTQDRARTEERPSTPVPHRTPLTPAQRRIWFLERLHPGTTMYCEPKAIRLDGPLDVPALHEALQRVVDRHSALRTVFGEADGVPYQEVRDRVTLDCPVEDRTGATVEEALSAVLETEGRRPLDLAEGPLLTARLLRLSEERHLLFLLAHHIVFDSSSTAVLVRDLAAHYRARTHGDPGLPPLPQLGAAERPDPASLDFWRRTLGDAPELTLPTDRPRPPVRSGAGASLTRGLDAELTGRLRTFAAGHRATLFMALTGAIGAVLGRLGGQHDVVLGTAVAARPAGAEQHVGLFLDTVPLRVDLAGDPDFPTLLHRVREGSTAAYEHSGVPFDELVGALNPRRDPGRNPLFQVLVEYENEGEVDFDPPRLTAALLDVPSARAPFDLTVYLTHHRDGLRFMVEYDTALFDEGTVRRFVDHVEQVLRRALDTPGAPLAELTAVTDADRAASARLGRLDEPLPAVEDTLHGLFERQARRTPDAVAVVDGELRVKYGELAQSAHRIARALRARGAARGERVALLMPRGPQLIAALLGILKSGAAYLPLDAAAPTPRLRELLADGTPVLLLASEAALARHEGLADQVPVQLAEDIPAGDSGPLDDDVRPEDPAYCLYTSGSTGRPKGVVVPHRGPANLVRAHLAEHPPLRTLQWTSPVFDVSVQEIFTTLAAGATLVLVDDEVRYDPAAVAETVRRHEVQRMFMPCTPLKYLIGTEPQLPSLRQLFSAGETLRLTDAFRRFLAAHPRCELYNQYGPTETSVIVTSHRVDPDGEALPPIGTPVPGARIRLLDASGRPVPVGAVGEIHVGGVPVAHGYLARPAETAAAFLADGAGGLLYRTGDLGRWRTDGTLQYCGRADDQVKIRGHRVEPAEIQAALADLPGVRDAVVLPRRDRHGESELVAHVVAAAPPDELRAALARRLPGHLVPTRWVRLDRLPVNASGKLDRARLPEPEDRPREPEEGPGTEREQALHDLWCDELGLARVPVTRSYFALGGHSLGAIRLLHRMADELGVDLAMADFFRAPTIRDIAAHAPVQTITDMAAPTPDPQVVDVVDSAPMTSTLRRLWRRHHERADRSVHNVAHRIELHGDLDTGSLIGALDDLVRRHHALRSRCVLRDGRHVVEVLGEVPVEVPVEELSADAVDGWCREQASRPFAMDRAPLFRFRLARLGPDRWVLVTVLHHAVCDGWSMGVLWRELEQLYRARRGGTELPEPTVQFTDVARDEHALDGARRARLEHFWRTELDGVPLRLELPADRPRPERLSGRGALHSWTVGADTPGRVADTAARLGVTPYAVLAAAFATWAAERCGAAGDVVLAASSANRTRRERAEVVGLLGDAVLLRARLAQAVTFDDLARQLGATLFGVLDHQELPLTEVAELVAPGVTEGPFPTVLFTVVTTPPATLDLPSVRTRVRGLPTSGVARTELYVVLEPGEEDITVTFEYSTDLFTPATVEAWASSLTAVLQEVTRAPVSADRS